MHSLTIEMVRILVRVALSHSDELSPETARSLGYCLGRMEQYARQDWDQIRDLQPLLLVLGRRSSQESS